MNTNAAFVACVVGLVLLASTSAIEVRTKKTAGSEAATPNIVYPPAKSEITQKTDNVNREGLGENLPYPGIDCE